MSDTRPDQDDADAETRPETDPSSSTAVRVRREARIAARDRALARKADNPIARAPRERQPFVITDRTMPPVEIENVQYALPDLPQLKRRSSKFAILSFFAIFVVPVSLIGAYYYFVASDIYKVDFRFAVRNNNSLNQTNSAMSSVMSMSGVSTNNDSINYQVADFITSRSAIDALQAKDHLTELYARSSIDWLSRFDRKMPLEVFEKYWQSMVSAQYDQVTGIVAASVKAFKAEDAYLIATSLVTASEDLVNKVQQRTLDNAVKSAEQEVKSSQARLDEAHTKLTEFRKAAGVIDPTGSLIASNSSLIQSLQSTLATQQAKYDSLVKQRLDPKSVVMTSLSNEIASTREQLKMTGTSVAAGRDQVMPGGAALGKDSLSNVVSQYEKLNLDYQFAQTVVTSALSGLEQAKVNAFTQQLYLTPYVNPSLPTSAQYPRRMFMTVLSAVICFVVWFVFFSFTLDLRERLAHANG